MAQGVRTAFGFAGYHDGDDVIPKADEGEATEAKPVFGEEETGPSDSPAIELFADDAPPGAEVKTPEETPQPETVEAN